MKKRGFIKKTLAACAMVGVMLSAAPSAFAVNHPYYDAACENYDLDLGGGEVMRLHIDDWGNVNIYFLIDGHFDASNGTWQGHWGNHIWLEAFPIGGEYKSENANDPWQHHFNQAIEIGVKLSGFDVSGLGLGDHGAVLRISELDEKNNNRFFIYLTPLQDPELKKKSSNKIILWSNMSGCAATGIW